jgi:ABC-type multidrug transport system fused ATPase/permease subunit
MELMEFVPELFAAHEPAAGSGEPGPLANLNVRNLNVGRNEILLDGVSFDVAKGETLLITGTSGRGKTTLLMSLIGIIDNLGGDVFWDGTQIEKIDPAKMRRQTGYAGAEPYLIAGSIRENLLFGVEHIAYSDAQIKEALWGACAEFVYDSPDGLDHMLKENGDGISAGQKQRLSLARCLLRKPGVLLLDEATANVDEETEGRLMGRIRDLLPDSIILMISHRSSLTRFADRILPLDGLPADDRAEAVSVGG